MSLLHGQYSEAALINMLGEMRNWVTARGPNKGKPLAPTTLLTLSTALLTGVAYVTGQSPSSSRIKRAVRNFTEATKAHVRKQAIPASRAEVEAAVRDHRTDRVTSLAITATWALGCRVEDIHRLQFKDMTAFSLRRKNDVIRVRCRAFKGQKPGLLGYWRYIPLTNFTKPLIQFVLQGLRHQSQYLFPLPMYRKILLALKRVNPTLTGHSLRRGIATLLACNGWSEKRIQAFLGHQSIETTRQYIQPHPTQANVLRHLIMATSAL